MQDGGEEDETIGATRQFFGELNDAGQDARRLDDGGVGASSEGILAFQFNGEIETLVEDARERVRRVETDWRQYRHHFAHEIIADPFALGFIPGGAAKKPDTLFGECRQDDVVELLVLLGDDGVGFGGNQPESLLGRFAITRDDQ